MLTFMSSQNMPLITQDSGDRNPGPSGTNTPPSTRSSSLSVNSNTSSTLFTDTAKRSSLKPSLKSPHSQSANTSRTSSPPTVRFADLGPVTEAKSKTYVQPYYQKQIKAHPNQVPNPLLQIRQYPVLPASSARHSIGPQSFAAQPPQTASAPQTRHDKMHAIRRFSAPMQTTQPDPRWSGIPLPAGYAPPTRPSKSSRNSSFHSAISNLSVQSAPPNLTSTSADAPIGQYNPLEHFVPCMYPDCSVHYSAAHTGPTYYLPLGSYSLSRLQGFCPRHATKDHKEASARCKREYESLRQGAGRKTLGQIAQEFELFLDALRQDRQQESADLLQEQKQVVLGISTASSKQQAVAWNWRYMPRPCTKAGCQREHYSPFANHLYAFYFTWRASSFLPMHTLCPSCSKAEIETFENSIHEKWTSRCGWDDDEWEEWFCNAVKDRTMELEFWDKGQERVVREKGPPKWAQRAADAQDMAEEKSVQIKPLQKRRSLLKRWFTISA